MKSPEEKVSIIIVTYNALEHVQTCVESVLANTNLMHQIIMVDNCSAKPTRDYVASLSGEPNIKVILNEENRLWSPGNNQGIAAADKDSKFVLLLNSDVKVLSPQWLVRMQGPMHRYKKIGITGTQYNFLHYKPNYGAIDGCCFFVRRHLFDKIGYLDESYPWNGAGFMFTLKAWKNGYFYYHVDRPDLLVHYGKKSRISSQTQLVNQKVDKTEVYQKADIVPGKDYFAFIKFQLGRFNVNKKLRHFYDV